MPVVAGLQLTARAAQLLTEAYAAHQTGDTEATSAILGQALRECPEQALAILWAACLGDIPAPDDPAWQDFLDLQRQVARDMEHWSAPV